MADGSFRLSWICELCGEGDADVLYICPDAPYAGIHILHDAECAYPSSWVDRSFHYTEDAFIQDRHGPEHPLYQRVQADARCAQHSLRNCVALKGIRQRCWQLRRRYGIAIAREFMCAARTAMIENKTTLSGKPYRTTRPGRRGLSVRTRYIVMVRDGKRCVICGRTAADTTLHVDHITPVSLGGSNEVGNLRTLCADCNLGKSSLTIEMAS